MPWGVCIEEENDSAEELLAEEAAGQSIKGKGSVCDVEGLFVGQRLIAGTSVEVCLVYEVV